MADGDRCPRCGRPLTAGRCLACENQWRFRFVHRELLLLVFLVLVTIGSFLFTRTVAAGNRRMRAADAEAWYERGRSALDAGDLEGAVSAYRHAVVKDSENVRFRIALARALSAAHYDAQARQILMAVRDLQPEDPEINVQLARMERASDPEAAVRYYKNALAAWWRADQTPLRRQIRTELIQYLLARGNGSRALAELLLLNTELPDDAGSQAEAGQLFMAAGDPAAALERFSAALELDPSRAEAHVGAGEAAFALGDYPRALRELSAVSSLPERARTERDVAALVLSSDPLAARLGFAERKRRLSAALEHVQARIEACSPAGAASGDLQALQTELATFAKDLSALRARDASDAVENGLDLIGRAEDALGSGCGQPAPLDRALALIAHRHGTEGR